MKYTPSWLINGIINKSKDHPVFQRLQAKIGYKAPREIRPMNATASISDLFVWRVNDQWETQFSLFNQLSHMFPASSAIDPVSVVVFGADGIEIVRKQIDLEPNQRLELKIESLLPDGCSHEKGTVSFFHDTSRFDQFPQARSHLTERGYIAYRKRGGKLWSYMHGNLHALSKIPGKPSLSYVGGHGQQIEPYRPQLRFDDCNYFELAFVNPTPKAQRLNVSFLDAVGQEIGLDIQDLQPRGAAIVACDNTDRAVVTVQASGKVHMWRPAIFKLSKACVDVFHG